MKNNTFLASVFVSVLAGVFIGYSIWGVDTMNPTTMETTSTSMSSNSGAHQMPDGSIMGGSGMENMMEEMMAGINGRTGDAFDKAFLSEMIVHHQGAVEMAEAVLTSSKRPELITLAKNIIAAQNTEIKMMKDWQTKWFGVQR